MKKSYVVVLLVLALGLSTGFASAGEPQKQPEQRACSEQNEGPKKIDPAAVVKFNKETLEQRKKLAGAHGALGALMKQEAPDADKARAIAEEIFELREQLMTKAMENGLPPFFGGGERGFGPHDKGPGFGPQGKGPGCGRQGMGPGFGPMCQGPGFGPQGKGPGFGPQGKVPGCGRQGMGPGFGPQCGPMGPGQDCQAGS